jgi:hypothetical protein
MIGFDALIRINKFSGCFSRYFLAKSGLTVGVDSA